MTPDQVAAALLAYDFALGDQPTNFANRFEAMRAAIIAANTYRGVQDAEKLPSDTSE